MHDSLYWVLDPNCSFLNRFNHSEWIICIKTSLFVIFFDEWWVCCEILLFSAIIMFENSKIDTIVMYWCILKCYFINCWFLK